MPAGSVTVAADGSVTKSGLAEAIYDARLAMLADVEPPGVVPVGPAGYPLKHGLALGATADATAIFTYLLTNGEASGVIKVYAGAAAPSGYLLSLSPVTGAHATSANSAAFSASTAPSDGFPTHGATVSPLIGAA